MPETATRPKVSLFCTEGGSDKVYTLWIESASKGLFTVEAQWGRRGGSMQCGAKTPKPVPLAEAEKVYDKIVKEKLAKGYHQGEDAPAFSQVAGAVDTGLRPMLLTDATDEGVEKYVASDEWGAQEKMNGKRIMLRAAGDRAIGVNKRGLECPIPKEIERIFGTKRMVLDGELIGDVYHAFDLIEEGSLDGTIEDVGAEPCAVRHRILKTAVAPLIVERLRVVDLVTGQHEKAELVRRLKEGRKEGVVFKRLEAPYSPGRIENLKKAVAVKVKFYASISALVLDWTDKSSVAIALEGTKERGGVGKNFPCGKVTVPAKYADKIEKGSIIRVRYLYATDAGILYQPNLDPTEDGLILVEQASPDSAADLKFEGKDE